MQRTTLTTLSEENKRWIVFGIALNYVLVPSIRPILEQEILKEYNALKLNHGIDVQTIHSFPGPKYPKRDVMRYENINGNDTKLKPPDYKKFDYSKFEYKVTSHVDLVKLFLPSHMAKLKAFDKTCDASAVLNLLGKIPVLSGALQNTANIVREGRNAWAHCDFTEWTEANFKTRFDEMEQLIIEVGLLPHANISKVLSELRDWEEKGVALCMSASIDHELVKVVREHVSILSTEVKNMKFEKKEELENVQRNLRDFEQKLQKLQLELDEVKQQQISMSAEVDELKSNQDLFHQKQISTAAEVDEIKENQHQLLVDQEAVQQRVTVLESDKKSCLHFTAAHDFSNCEADINYYFERYDLDTRQWLLSDFDTWFSNPGNSRAYVLLGDAAVGKSVMAAVIARRAQERGNMAAAYFCRHYDGTRRDPRYLLGTIAYQLCNCHDQYNEILGGEERIQRMLANSKLGLHELFTKLLEEPLNKCIPSIKKLVVIDALDESEYLSREDFLDLIMDRFPQLPEWLVFFITSRPEDTVQYRLKMYNPCIKICAGNSDSEGIYKQHNQDIQRFFEKSLKFSISSDYALKLTGRCNGMFLYAFYLVEILNKQKSFQDDVMPENINDFFRKNFKRIYDKVGEDFYQKLLGCVLMTPSPLPLSFISFLLKRENSPLDEQEVIDVVSQFVVLRNTDKTFAFLHSLIPDWLTDEEKSSRKLFVEKKKASVYFTNIVVEFLNAFLQENLKLFSDKIDLVSYILCSGFRFLCNSRFEDCEGSKIVFDSLTNYRFLQHRISSSKTGIYSLIGDLKFSIERLMFHDVKKAILEDIYSVLERDKLVLIGSPQLLHSCLCSPVSLVGQKITPENISATWMESSVKEHSVIDVLARMKCGAFSHDKKLFAGRSWNLLYLYDACTFEKIAGPVEVILGVREGIEHLEFSSDDRFVFFGRLDFWFSVKEKRVVKFSQFSGNSLYYNFGSCIYDSTYIVVNRSFLTFHFCFVAIFGNWAKYELNKSAQNNIEGNILMHDLDATISKHCCFCIKCREFEKLVANSDETAIYNRILLLYAEIFDNQIWNLKTGRPVLEEMLSSHLEPFFYIWHLLPGIKSLGVKISDETLTLANVALVNLFWQIRFCTFEIHSIEGVVSKFFPARCNAGDLWCTIANISRELYALLNYDDQRLSKDGKWLVKGDFRHGQERLPRRYFRDKGRCKFVLFETENQHQYVLKNRSDLLVDAPDVIDCAFVDNSNFLVYATHSSSRNLHALSLQNETKLHSIFGRYPLYYLSGEVLGLGFLFSRSDERVFVLLKDLPVGFLKNIFGYFENQSTIAIPGVIKATFSSHDSVNLLCSDGYLDSVKITDGCLVKPRVETSLSKFLQIEKFQECICSHNRGLIAVHTSCEVLVKDGLKSPCLIFQVKDECEHTVSCLTFSTDDSLLLFCIEKRNSDQSFYLWNVEHSFLTGPFSLPFPYDTHVDCCCFSFADNSKLFFCNAFSVLVLKYQASKPAIVVSSSLAIPNINSSASDLCSHCTVSSDKKLLACCIGNEIFLYPLNGPDKFLKVAHNHQGVIQYCTFLCGSRYLLSYGIDGLVFLFDLVRWKTIAYSRQESIISMAVSPDEDKIVCLELSGKVNLIYLHGLERRSPLHFDLSSNLLSAERNDDEAQAARVLNASVDMESEEEDYLFDEEDQMSPYSSESSDSPDELDIIPDHSANYSGDK